MYSDKITTFESKKTLKSWHYFIWNQGPIQSTFLQPKNLTNHPKSLKMHFI